MLDDFTQQQIANMISELMQWQLKPATEIPKHCPLDGGGEVCGRGTLICSRTGSPNYLRNVCKHCEVQMKAGKWKREIWRWIGATGIGATRDLASHFIMI